MRIGFMHHLISPCSIPLSNYSSSPRMIVSEELGNVQNRIRLVVEARNPQEGEIEFQLLIPRESVSCSGSSARLLELRFSSGVVWR
ncbi:hypothetical protein NPIL_622641 [Nephila pilipes]|uniref:Uncharacterized protein n=1 Tax=Nephila pilipes TaxID=299642 RepID=A0A8X6N5L0_NEPPI|nr:hypothetical protein NPIL_622641 [Nephila pilipes]